MCLCNFVFVLINKHVKCLLMLTCIGSLWTEQKRTPSTAAWRIMTVFRTAVEDQENAWGNKCHLLLQVAKPTNFQPNMVWHTAFQIVIDKFCSIVSVSYCLKQACVRCGLCFHVVFSQAGADYMFLLLMTCKKRVHQLTGHMFCLSDSNMTNTSYLRV